VKTAEEVVWMALAAHRDDIAAESASLLAELNGYSLSRPADAERWDKVADALLRRLGPGHDRIAGWLHQNRANVFLRGANYRQAAKEFELALALKRRALPANDPDIAQTYNSIALTDIALKDGGAGLAAAEQALAIFGADYGSASPLLWLMLDTRGEAFEFLGRYEEAESDLRSALERVEGLQGSNHIWTAIVLQDLGKTLLDEKRLRQAIPILERALRIRERSEPSLENVAETRFTLGRALWMADANRPRALTLATTARENYQKLPGHAGEVAEIDAWLADKPVAARIELAAKHPK
jgi:serine/threonine-protein kinase